MKSFHAHVKSNPNVVRFDNLYKANNRNLVRCWDYLNTIASGLRIIDSLQTGHEKGERNVR